MTSHKSRVKFSVCSGGHYVISILIGWTQVTCVKFSVCTGCHYVISIQIGRCLWLMGLSPWTHQSGSCMIALVWVCVCVCVCACVCVGVGGGVCVCACVCLVAQVGLVTTRAECLSVSVSSPGTARNYGAPTLGPY